MKTKSLSPARSSTLMILALLAILLILLTPATQVLADSNAPTETNTPEPTHTHTPVPPTAEIFPTNTAVPLATQPPENIMNVTAIPLPTAAPNGGLSSLNRMLLVCLSAVTVLVIGVIVYLVYHQTRGGGLGNR